MENTHPGHVQNVYETARKQIRYACELFDECRIDQNLYETVSHPERIIEVNIPVRMDDGRIRMFTGYRSQHNNARWPYKWGIRFHQDVTKEEVKALSMWMSIKCAVLDLPLGGGKWGVVVNPRELSEWELERLSRWYVRSMVKYLGPQMDIPAPDVNTNSKIMAWMMDEYSELVGEYSPGSFTGKPLSAWWSRGRDRATALWGMFVLSTFLKKKKEKITGKKVIIEGAGNAGLTMAKLLSDSWATIVGISDSKWAIYDIHGVDIEEIIRLKSEKKTVVSYPKGVQLTNDELLVQQADILIPAALENRITKDNASLLKAKLVLELANGPTTVEADEVLLSRGIPVIPDILANAGGVTVSYFEQLQNNSNYYWSESEVEQKLESKMRNSTEEVCEVATKYQTHLRAGAYIIALKRIIEAMQARGMV